MTTPPESLAKLKSFLEKPQGVLGSQIGQFISTDLTEISLADIKSEYGNIQKYLRHLFGDKIVVVNRQGADTIWRLELGAVSNKQSGIEATSTLWSIFTNPQKRGRLYINNENIVFSETEVTIGNELIRMTLDEHHEIIRNFKNKLVALDDQESFEHVLSQNEGYWPRFLKALETCQIQGTDYFARWKSFREESIEALFEKRCATYNYSNPLIDKLWRQLRGLAPTPNTKIRDNVIEALSHLNETDFEQVQITMPMAVLSRMLRK